jgi:hypothetical protein
LEGLRAEGAYTGKVPLDASRAELKRSASRLLTSIERGTVGAEKGVQIAFQVNDTGTRVGFQSDVEFVNEVNPGATIVARLLDAKGPSDDLRLQPNGDVDIGCFAIFGQVTLPDASGQPQTYTLGADPPRCPTEGGRTAPGAQGMAWVVAGSGQFFHSPTIGKAHERRPEGVEALYAFLGADIFIDPLDDPNTPADEGHFSTQLLPIGAYLCTLPDGSVQAKCQGRAGPTAGGARRPARSVSAGPDGLRKRPSRAASFGSSPFSARTGLQWLRRQATASSG